MKALKVIGLTGWWEPEGWEPTEAEAMADRDALVTIETKMLDEHQTLDVAAAPSGRRWVFHQRPKPRPGNARYLALIEEMRDLHVRKSAGYSGQDNPDTWANFREAENWGSTALMGCLIRMGDKFRRLQNLTRDASNEQVGESFRDTAIDLASYALIAVCLSEEPRP